MTAAAGRAAGDAIAAEVHRLAVLLEAGLSPVRAWRYAEGGVGDVADQPGVDIAARLAARGGTWQEVATAWRVATVVGAPLAPALRSVAEALRDAEHARDDVAIALAEPATTARLIGWLPVLAVLLVVAFGFDVSAAANQPLGIASLLLGATFMIVGRRWTRALVRAAQPPEGIAGWACELVCIALHGGVSIERALAVVREAGCARAGEETAAILRLSHESGAPAIELLRAEAAERRRMARTQGRLRVARLAGRLLLPLGVCTLPAFLLLGVGPMLFSVFAAAPIAF